MILRLRLSLSPHSFTYLNAWISRYPGFPWTNSIRPMSVDIELDSSSYLAASFLRSRLIFAFKRFYCHLRLQSSSRNTFRRRDQGVLVKPTRLQCALSAVPKCGITPVGCIQNAERHCDLGGLACPFGPLPRLLSQCVPFPNVLTWVESYCLRPFPPCTVKLVLSLPDSLSARSKKLDAGEQQEVDK